MKIKTSELTGPALDWAVAKCEGWIKGDIAHPKWCKLWVDFPRTPAIYPSTDWSQGGPIIERRRIELCSYSNDGIDTAFRSKGDDRGNYSHEEEYVISVPEIITWTAWVKYGSYKQDGPTPLVAAMRCYVASKLGDAVNVPEELV